MFVVCFDKLQPCASRQLNIGQIGSSMKFPMYSFTLGLFLGFTPGNERSLFCIWVQHDSSLNVCCLALDDTCHLYY
jgi:hypothetical protein